MYFHIISSLPMETVSPHYSIPIYSHNTVPPMPKVNKKDTKKYLTQVLDSITTDPNNSVLVVTDANYLKSLLHITAANQVLGELCQCKFEGYEDLRVVYLPNPLAAKYNQQVVSDIQLANTLLNSLAGGKKFSISKANAKHMKQYPHNEWSIEAHKTLRRLLHEPELSIDIEATGLKFYKNKLVSISFSNSEKEAYTFWIYKDKRMTQLIRNFLQAFKGKAIYHNASFDVTQLVYHLFMSHLDDFSGMLHGIDTLTESVEDTKLLAFVSLNSTVRPSLSLKDLAYEYLGKYAEDVTDILKLPKDTILLYNGKDTMGTFYIWKKYFQMAKDEDQLDVYNTILKASLPKVIQMQLTGMPLDMKQVHKVGKALDKEEKKALYALRKSSAIRDVVDFYAEERAKAKTRKAKKKVYTPDECRTPFNPNSPNQLVTLLYTQLGLPILATTKTKAPATGGKVISRLLDLPQCTPEIKFILGQLIQYKKASKLLNTFIPAFKAAPKTPSGYRLYGNFNIGGTFSGRLSSSDVNLQQLPSGGRLGKLIKSCFKAPKGWVMVGIDFNALEDRVNALITKDSNKLKVYTENYDSHSLRAFFYFPERLTDIRQAEPTERCFKISQGGSIHYCKEGDLIVTSDGRKIEVSKYVKENS